ncbi:MAG: septum formation initiator family protein [Chloroflexi bacterium]|nr:septum formation initiator family protein [Chloroflexota bacterium]
MMFGGLSAIKGGRLLLLLALPVLIYFGFATIAKAIETYELKQEQGRIQRDIGQLESRNADLQKTADYLKSDDYIEKVAREQLNLIKPGEKAVVVIAPPGQQPPSAVPENAAKVDTRPNWRRWWDLFFGP